MLSRRKIRKGSRVAAAGLQRSHEGVLRITGQRRRPLLRGCQASQGQRDGSGDVRGNTSGGRPGFPGGEATVSLECRGSGGKDPRAVQGLQQGRGLPPDSEGDRTQAGEDPGRGHRPGGQGRPGRPDGRNIGRPAGRDSGSEDRPQLRRLKLHLDFVRWSNPFRRRHRPGHGSTDRGCGQEGAGDRPIHPY